MKQEELDKLIGDGNKDIYYDDLDKQIYDDYLGRAGSTTSTGETK